MLFYVTLLTIFRKNVCAMNETMESLYSISISIIAKIMHTYMYICYLGKYTYNAHKRYHRDIFVDLLYTTCCAILRQKGREKLPEKSWYMYVLSNGVLVHGSG